MKFITTDRGLVHVYTGDGKGKTSAALGLALRAISYKKRVLIIQFIKGPWISGELNVTKKLRPNLQIKAFGEGFVKILGDKKPFRQHKKAAQAAFNFAIMSVSGKKFDIVILDELNVAIHTRLISVTQAINLIKSKSPSVELVLTGRHAPARIINLADYVSEIRMIKHPYQKGILARKTIDY